MPTATVEDYVKRLYVAQQRIAAARAATGDTSRDDLSGHALVPVGALASAMGVVPGTATTMVKALADSGLVEYVPRLGVRLTRNGEQLALHVLRRHRLVELFLVNVLRLDWSEVHAEAETLEHAVSDKVLNAIDQALGFPLVDPHGDPIPSAKGTVAAVSNATLVDCAVERRWRVRRVMDQAPAFLQFVERCGLRPGAAVRVLERDTAADSVTVIAEGKRPAILGWSAAAKIVVGA